MVLSQTRVIDGRDHLLGRLASIVAKELLAGQKVVITRCDEVVISGSLTRNRVKYALFRQKRMNTNPARGPFHFKSPSMMVWRTIRGMVHQKSIRGQDALKRLSCFEGVPAPYDKMKRVVIPAALKVMRLKPTRAYTIVGDLANSVGWKHQDLLKRLEVKRKEDANEFYEKKKAITALRVKAIKEAAPELEKINTVLAQYGY